MIAADARGTFPVAPCVRRSRCSGRCTATNTGRFEAPSPGASAVVPPLRSGVREGDAHLPAREHPRRRGRARGAGRRGLRRRLPHAEGRPDRLPAPGRARPRLRAPRGAGAGVRRGPAPDARSTRFLAASCPRARSSSASATPTAGEFDIWPHFRPIFELAKEHRLELVAIDRRAAGPALARPARRGRGRAHRRRRPRADDRPLVLVLVGQFHVAPSHLPARVRAALGETAPRAPGRLPERRRRLLAPGRARAWRATSTRWSCGRDALSPWSRASPVVCQRSFLDYVEAERGDAPLDETRPARHLRAAGAGDRPAWWASTCGRELPKVGVVTATTSTPSSG